MPRKNFKNIGELQGYEYLKGVITDDPDQDADTCAVRVKDAEGNDVEFADTPIFYHCSEDAVEREDNGAIEGAATGFAKDDEVIVLKQRPDLDDKIFVIGHIGGIAPCCFIEPWSRVVDGEESAYAAITDKYPWAHLVSVWVEESYLNNVNRTANYPFLLDYDSLVFEDGEGSIVIDSPSFNIAAPYDPSSGPAVTYEQTIQYKLTDGTYIKKKARKVKFDAEGYTRTCYNSPGTAMAHNYSLLFSGKGPDGVNVTFEVVVLWNSPGLYERIGCTDAVKGETEWLESHPSGYTKYRKNILENNGEWIELPRFDVDINEVDIYFAMYNLDRKHPVGGYLTTDAGYLKVNHIAIC